MSILRGLPTKRCAQSAPSPPGLRPGHADGGAVPARTRVGATRERATAPRLNACLRTCVVASPEDIGAPAPPCGAPSASLPGLTISTYGLRRAPRIRSVLATTHHAPIIELGSSASRKPRVTSRLLPAVLEALRRVFFVELAQHIVRLQPHHIDDPEREGEADTEYPREIPHADFLLIHGMGMLPDLFHRHLSAHHTVDPRRIRDDDRQHQDYHPEHDMQRPMARHGVPHGEAALRA